MRYYELIPPHYNLNADKEYNMLNIRHITLLALFSVTTTLALSIAVQSATTKWEPIGLSGGGGMFSPAISPVNPKLMMINCDMGAAYISSDGGRKWQMIHYSQLRTNTSCRPAFHPTDPKTIYAANDWSGLAISKDAGVTWKSIGNLPGNLTGEIAINPSSPQQMLVGAGGGVMRSDDAGVTWTRCDGPSGEVLAFHFDQTTPGACFAGTTDGVWISKDDGKTWEKKTSGLPADGILDFSGGSNAKDGCLLYVTTPGKEEDGKYTGGIYSSTDRGNSWQCINGQGLNLETKPFDEWPMDNIAQYKHIATTNVRPRTVYAFNSSTGVPPPHNASVYRSDDAGGTWRASFQADPRWEPMNVEKDYVVYNDGQYYQDIPRIAICATNPDILLTVDNGHAYTTIDGGKSWQLAYTQQAPEIANKQRHWICNGLVVTTTWNYYIDPFKPANHYICYTDMGFARSEDGAKTWEWWALKGRAPWTNTCYELAFDPEIPGKVWGAFSNVHDIPNDNIISGRHNGNGPGGICISTDYAATWTPSNQGLPVTATTSVVIDPRSPKGNRTLYAGQFGKGVFKSTDDGKTWTAKNEGLGAPGNLRVCRVALHKDGTLFALVTALRRNGSFTKEGVGLFRSVDGGDHWAMVNESQLLLWPKDFTVDLKSSKIIYIGAADARDEKQGGLWRTTDGGATWKCILKKGPEHFGAYLHPKHPGWIYATLTEGAPDSGLWLSKDNGTSWSAMSGLPFGNAQRVTFDPADPETIYVTTFGGSVWKGPAHE